MSQPQLTNRQKRLISQRSAITSNWKEPNCTIIDNSGDDNWYFLIDGLPNTLFQKGTYFLKISIPQQYPFKAPSITFLNKIWHPNVNPDTGLLCKFKEWSPASTIWHCALYAQGILDAMDFEYFLNDEAIQQLNAQNNKFIEHVTEWVNQYASLDKIEIQLEKLMQILEITMDEATQALLNSGFEVTRALTYFFKEQNMQEEDIEEQGYLVEKLNLL